MALEGRHRHKKGYEHWRYRRSFGIYRNFDCVPHKIKKNPGRFRLILRYASWKSRRRKYSGLASTTFREFYSKTDMHNHPYYFE